MQPTFYKSVVIHYNEKLFRKLFLVNLTIMLCGNSVVKWAARTGLINRLGEPIFRVLLASFGFPCAPHVIGSV